MARGNLAVSTSWEGEGNTERKARKYRELQGHAAASRILAGQRGDRVTRHKACVRLGRVNTNCDGSHRM